MRFTLEQNDSGTPPTAVDFLPPGGTIGRSVDNDLVLPDEDRAISRLQALVHVSASGECRLTNRGSVTSVVLNGVPLARGHQVELQHGDSLGIGDYQIQVTDPAQPVAAADTLDPLDLFNQDASLAVDPLGILAAEQPIIAAGNESSPGEKPPVRAAHHSDARLDIDPLPHEAREQSEQHAACSNEKLIQALLEGMGLDSRQNKLPLTEEEMRMTGRMLSLFSQGTVALLSSRSILKRGVKAEMTMILNEANNPFKILPSGKTVLMQMYQSQMPGFMQPEQAVRDALVDLQAHQLGMIAGIRAIIAAMLQSFNPQRLEDQAKSDGLVGKMSFASSRKAAMWDYFVRDYQNTAGEIEDDFHTLFGEAFLHAYDVEVNQYKDSQLKADAE
ncbi:type VI secretion system-associated FHA domain protein TagH [Winslowiella iniecta]|uniref:Type VI secretion system, core protein n=1 Tax=Winslowiella iniecta TaxID=1560201 RepID=A0A0L7T9C2_9GAMM|nr:type VI secretion system-associated FHA domain protein TagH [Winslowiella iniecta]KOC91965.1 type VI secretion system, core protein [Winslowiella iniecta]KOC94913.1 type VI secretion system, core protein [Winslowiella iniecta]